jgi:hypothetical protein
MPNPEPKVKADKKDQKSWASVEDVKQGFAEALQNLVKEFYNGQNNAHQQAMDAYQKLLDKLKVDLEGTQKRYEDVNRIYVAKMQEAWGQVDAQTRSVEAHRDYLKGLQDMHPEIQESFTSAYRKYLEALQKLWETAQKHNRSASEKYFQTVKQQWSSMDLNAIDYNTMISISQMIVAGYLYTGANTILTK